VPFQDVSILGVPIPIKFPIEAGTMVFFFDIVVVLGTKSTFG
jgi:hypothetical protein